MKEALKLALDALEEPKEHIAKHLRIEAITAIKEALAQLAQKPVAWKLVPTEPTEEMLKAMDECSTEGYDERLYAGHAASVYMAAIDATPTPPQRTEERNFCPRCGKRTADLTVIHTCTPPQENT